MNPLLDPKKLTDDEIVDRLNKAYNYMNFQKSVGHVATVLSIKEIIDTLEEENRNRMNNRIQEELKRRNPNELNSIDLGKLE